MRPRCHLEASAVGVCPKEGAELRCQRGHIGAAHCEQARCHERRLDQRAAGQRLVVVVQIAQLRAHDGPFVAPARIDVDHDVRPAVFVSLATRAPNGQ